MLQADVFDIEAVSVEKLKKILIGHDNSGNRKFPL